MEQRRSTPDAAVETENSWSFHPDHQRAVDRRRRIIVQYDPGDAPRPENDVQEWTEYGFQYFDQPDSQVDAIWWDFDPMHPVFHRMPADTEVDGLAVALKETRTGIRGLLAPSYFRGGYRTRH